jgi:hypothetical protein
MDPNTLRPHIHFSAQVLQSLYGLKQSGRTWYQHFQNKLRAIGFQSSDIAPCLFIKNEGNEFIIIAIYVNDLNLFGTNKILLQTITLLKEILEVRDLGQTTFCLGLQFKSLQGILLHQSKYTEKLLKQFNMHTAKAVKSPMDIRSIEKKKDIFRK